MSASSTSGPFTSPADALHPLTAALVRSKSPSQLVGYIAALWAQLRDHTHEVDSTLPSTTRRRREGRLDHVRSERRRQHALRRLGRECSEAAAQLNAVTESTLHAHADLVARIVEMGDDVWQELFVQLELDLAELLSRFRGARSTLARHLLESMELQLDEMANGNATHRSAPLQLGGEEHAFKRLDQLRHQIVTCRQTLEADESQREGRSLGSAWVGQGISRMSRRAASRYEL